MSFFSLINCPQINYAVFRNFLLLAVSAKNGQGTDGNRLDVTSINASPDWPSHDCRLQGWTAVADARRLNTQCHNARPRTKHHGLLTKTTSRRRSMRMNPLNRSTP